MTKRNAPESTQSNRKIKQRPNSTSVLTLAHFSFMYPVKPFWTLAGQQRSMIRGLLKPENLTSIKSTVCALESMVRSDHSTARVLLQDLIPVAAAERHYRDAFDLWKRGSHPIAFRIESFPDIFVPLVQALFSSSGPVVEDIIVLIRSCLPFTHSSRRVQSDSGWSSQHQVSSRVRDWHLCSVSSRALLAFIFCFVACVTGIYFLFRRVRDWHLFSVSSRA